MALNKTEIIELLKEISENETKGDTVEGMVDYIYGKDTWIDLISTIETSL